MRFLFLFFRIIFFFAILGAVVFFGGREIWLYVASHRVAQEAQRISQTARWQNYYSHCYTETQVGEGLPFRGVQLRFLDATQYSTEIDCVSAPTYQVQSFQVLNGVRKTTGSAGFFFDSQSQQLSGELTLSFLGQSRVLYVDNGEVLHSWGTALGVGILPRSQCTGFGGQCCEVLDEQGEGTVWRDGVLDCPGECYPACLRRPILLSFQSNPSFTGNRELRLVGADQLVTFAYSFDPLDAEIQHVTVDFGDGNTRQVLGSSGQFDHSFRCPARLASCELLVRIQATDVRGVTSTSSRLSEIRVILNQSTIQ